MKWPTTSKYGYLWVTFAFFVISFVGQWVFGWFSYVNEQTDLNAPIQFRLLRSLVTRHF